MLEDEVARIQAQRRAEKQAMDAAARSGAREATVTAETLIREFVRLARRDRALEVGYIRMGDGKWRSAGHPKWTSLHIHGWAIDDGPVILTDGRAIHGYRDNSRITIGTVNKGIRANPPAIRLYDWSDPGKRNGAMPTVTVNRKPLADCLAQWLANNA